MKQNKKAFSLLSFVLAMLMLLSSLAVIPAGAARITTSDEQTAADNLNWNIQLKNATSIEEIETTDQYTFDSKAADFKIVNGENCFAFNHAALHIKDTNNMLVKCDTFYVDYKVYFEKFPVGSRDGLTSDQYPIAIFTWIVDNNYDRSIRIDSQGNLFYTRYTTSAIGVQLSLNTWYNLRFAITPETGAFEIYLDNNLVFSKNYKSLLKSQNSIVRFFDSAYDYQAYVKDISVYSSNGYQIIAGVNSEKSADYLGYQTTTPTDAGFFNARFVSTLSDFDGYNQAGYNVLTTIKDSDGEITEYSENKNVKHIYEAINADGKSVTAQEYDAKYFTAFTVTDLPTDAQSIMLTVRPYVVKNGLRVYGHSTVLYYAGQMKDGRPVMTSDESDEGNFSELVACEDTYIQGAYADTPQGNNKTVVVKNNKGGSYERTAFVKFKFTDEIEDAFINAMQINLKLNITAKRGFTEQEEAAGGYMMDVYAVNSDWDEKTLTYSNSEKIIKQGEKVGEILVSSNGFVSGDVTDYVRNALLDGEEYVSFMLINAVDDGSGGQTVFVSKEDVIEKAPALEIYNGEKLEMNYELNLPKAGNEGYEPWGYAEKLVKEWMNGGKDKVYAADNNSVFELETVDVTKQSGAHTILTEGRSTGNPPSGKYQKQYARNIDTLIANGYTEVTAANESQFDEYGGVTNSGIKGNATGYYHVEIINNRHYLIDPLGNPIIINAVNTINAGSTSNQKDVVLEKFGTTEAYWEYMTEELMGRGINAATGNIDIITSASTPMNGIVSISGISSYMGSLGLSVSTGGSSAFAYNNTMNMFDPDFITYAEEKNKDTLIKYSTNDRVIGYTSDNELPKNKDMLINYLTLDPTIHYNAFSYAAAWTWLMAKTGKANPSLDDAVPEYYEEFKAFMYGRLFETVDRVIEKYDPNHMYIGTRADQANKTSEGYLRAAGTYCDMLTINMYDGMEPSVETMAIIYRYSGKPFIVTEFYAKAEDAYDMNGQLLANQQNAGWLVKTQDDRANYFENYTLLLLESKYCLGWVWYRFQDNDQSLYTNDGGKTILRVWERGNAYEIASYIDQDGNVIKATGTETQFYKGETDTSNLGSNKGIVDNYMDFYEILCSSMTRVSKNAFNLINYFDSIH